MRDVIIISTIKIVKGNSAGSARIMNIARSLSENQISVYLYSARMNKNLQIVSEVEKGIYIVGENVNHDSIIYKIINKLLPFCINFLFVYRIYKEIRIKFNNATVFIYPSTYLSLDLAALLILKIIGNYKIYCDVNEVRVAEILNRSFFHNFLIVIFKKIFIRFVHSKFLLQEYLTKYYDGLIAISSNIEKYFKIYNSNIIIVPILTNVKHKMFAQAPMYKQKDKFLICFTGSVYLEKEGFDNFYKSLSLLNSKFQDFELHLYGPILKHEIDVLLKILPKRYALINKIIYHGVVNQETIPGILRNHHLLILPRPLTAQTNYGFSTKLAEYLTSGVPVLVTDVSDNCIYIHDEVNGFVVPPDDVQAMWMKIDYIIRNYNNLSSIVVNGAFETAVNCFHYSKYGKLLSSFIS